MALTSLLSSAINWLTPSIKHLGVPFTASYIIGISDLPNHSVDDALKTGLYYYDASHATGGFSTYGAVYVIRCAEGHGFQIKVG